MEKKSMGCFLARLRKESGMTQKQLAEKLNVSDKAVSRWEREESAPDLSLIPVIAELFEITTDELLMGDRKSQNADKQSGEKRLEYLLSSARNQYTIRCIISYAIVIVGFILVWGLTGWHDVGALIGLLCPFLAAVYQTIATIQIFTSIGNWECDYDAAKLHDLKKYVIKLGKQVFRSIIFAFVLMLLRVNWLNGWELFILGLLWEGLAMTVCTILFRMLDKRILQNILE